MERLKSSSNTSPKKEVQLPLPGFMVEVESDKPGWRRYVETMLDGRQRYKSIKKR